MPASFECAAYRTLFLAPAAATMQCIIGDAPPEVGYGDGKWSASGHAISGRMPIGYPGYSGAVLTATLLLARGGWRYLEKLAQSEMIKTRYSKLFGV